nr:cellulose binding domain-containing protein [Actinoplanes lichenis]
MALVSGILVAAVAGGWAIAAAAGNDEGKPAGAVPPRPAGNPCVVSYSVWSDAKKRFKAAVILANRDTRPMAGWKLWFVLSGDQKVTGTGVTALRQNANAVTMSQPAPLQPQGTVTMQMTGRYQASNAAPMVFQLDGKPCDAYVSDAPGEPSRPVEVLPNGSIRLGAPVRQAPVPGISVDPDGVAVPVPVESDPAGDPSGGTDPSSSTDPGGGTDPGDDTSTDPGTGTGTDEPGTGTGTDEPGTGTGTDEPGTGTGTDEPDTGTGTGEPGGGNENPDPKPPGPDTGEPEEPEDPTAPVIDTEPPEAVDNDPVTVSEQSSAGGASAHEISASQT